MTDADVVAVVDSCDAEGNAVLYQRNKFFKGDELELLPIGGRPISFKVEQMFDAEGNEIEDTRHAMMELHMKLPKQASKYSIVRKCR